MPFASSHTAWCYVDYLFDEVLAPCKRLCRLRLYNLYTDAAHPRQVQQSLTQVALNHCAIDSTGLMNIFASSGNTLQRLHIEYPMDLDEQQLLRTLELVGPGLHELTVQGFMLQFQEKDPNTIDHLVDDILEVCPKLRILNFPEAIGSPKLLQKLATSHLELWSFSCNADVRPEHWLEAFKQPGFPHPANCRVYCSGKQSPPLLHSG